MILEILESVRQLFSDPTCWHKGEWARDINGEPCSFSDPNAVSWCIQGAVMREQQKGDKSIDFLAITDALYRVACETYGIGALEVNDTLGYDAVLNLLDKAIEREKSHGA